jgi:serine/threonine protein kinase
MNEQTIRINANFSEQYVINILRCHDGENDPFFQTEIERRGLQKYPYCIVMPAADRNLQNIVSSERIAGRDWVQIRTVASQVAESLHHMHQKGVMHGDVKPLNIMRCDGRIKLIDLDSSVYLLNGFSGGKSSTAYIPPELLYQSEGKTLIKNCMIDQETKGPKVFGLQYELVPAKYSHDAWAFGIVLYELCAGIKLFLQDDEDNIDP